MPSPIDRSGLIAGIARKLEAAGIEDFRFEAQLLVGHALSVPRASVIAQTFPEPTVEQRSRLELLVEQRALRLPMAHLRGVQEFYGLSFEVCPDVLIPRPETEMLVDFAIEIAGAGRNLGNGGLRAASEAASAGPMGTEWRFADVGAGSGCISIAVLAHLRIAAAIAVDISANALRVARNNAALNGVSNRVRMTRASLTTAIRAHSLDAVLSNPPYIPSEEIDRLQPEVGLYEPRAALDGGRDGLLHYRELAADAARVLKPGGWLAVEVGVGQSQEVALLFTAGGLEAVAVRRDLAGIERIVCGRSPIAP